MPVARARSLVGQAVSALETPAALVDLDRVDLNLAAMQGQVGSSGIAVRTHFKSLKCGGLAAYMAERGFDKFMAAKLCEAEVLADAGIRDIVVANQIVGEAKLRRLTELAERCHLAVCVDAPENVRDLSEAACRAGTQIGVLIEVDVGQGRCGVATPELAKRLALTVLDHPGLELVGLQGYDGQNQHVMDPEQRRRGCITALKRLAEFRAALVNAGIDPRTVSTAGTGTADIALAFPGVTEIQPGSYILMDCHYRRIAPIFHCSLSVLTTVISRRADQYCVLDAGYKAVSKDYELAVLQDESLGSVTNMSEEHTKVERPAASLQVGAKAELVPSHCCGTVNLHRQCFATRNRLVEAVWPIEASGRYD